MSIPTSATAYLLNVTAIPTSGMLSYLTIWPTGSAQPSVFTLSSPEGQIIANAAIVAAGTSNQISIFVTNTSNIVLDISGYFVAASGGSGVSSFNMRTGTVALLASDVDGVGAITNSTSGNAATATSATQLNGGAIPASQACVGTNGSSQIVAGTCSGGSLPTTTAYLAGNNAGGVVSGGIVDAASAQTGAGNNGIQNAVSTASSSSVSASIWAPPTYATTESWPCTWINVGQPHSLDGCAYSMPPNVTFTDYRYGIHSQNADSGGIYPASNYQAWQRNDYITTVPLSLTSNFFTSKVNVNNNLLALAGGVNEQVESLNYYNKAFYVVNDNRLHGYTAGQKIGVQSFNNSYAVGDALAFYGINTCYGGLNASGDEGCEAMDIQATQGTVEYTGTVASSSSNQVTVSVSAGDGTQGEGRFLVDTTAAITGGTISNIGSSGVPIVITGSGTSWPVSTVTTTSMTAISGPNGTLPAHFPAARSTPTV